MRHSTATSGPFLAFARMKAPWITACVNGDSRDEGVEEYLRIVRDHGEELPWHVIANRNGRVNAVAFGEPPKPIKYFYLYADEDSSTPYTV